MSEMGSHDPFGHLKRKLWSKEEQGIKLAISLLTTKSRESTRFPFVQVACHILLESSWWRLQLFFIPHLNQRSSEKVMVPQSRKSLKFGNFGTPTWESRDKKSHLDMALVERHIIYYKGGRWWLPPSSGRDESCEFELLVACPSTKSATTMH